jgi:hypothetical protein
MIVSIFIISFLIGVFVEWVAYRKKLWKYRRFSYLLFNILFVFTVVQGVVAFLCFFRIDDVHLSRILMFSIAGGVIGVLYEIFNEYVFKLFDFGPCLYRVLGKKKLILTVGMAWGCVPFISSLIYW